MHMRCLSIDIRATYLSIYQSICASIDIIFIYLFELKVVYAMKILKKSELRRRKQVEINYHHLYDYIFSLLE